MGVVKLIKPKVKLVKNTKNIKDNKEIIENLEVWLAAAKRGEIIGMTGVMLSNEKTLYKVYTGKVFENYLSFAGMIAELQIELKEEYNGE